jgi:multicomponent Na+:H+ antiporter subunit B
LGETAVVFTAGIGVLMLISALSRRRRDEDKEGNTDDTEGTS